MNIVVFLKRIFFYGLIILASVIIFFKLNITVRGEAAYKVFFALAVISGSIQSINFLIIGKISEVQKIQNIGFWARWRLRTRIENRRITAFARAAIGFITAILTGVFSAWMNVLGKAPVPYWGLGLASGITFISVLMLFITLYEFFVITKFETEINWKAESADRKKNALKSIKGDDKKSV